MPILDIDKLDLSHPSNADYIHALKVRGIIKPGEKESPEAAEEVAGAPKTLAPTINQNGKGILDPEIPRLFNSAQSNGWAFWQIKKMFCKEAGRHHTPDKTLRRYSQGQRVNADNYEPLKTTLIKLSQTKP